MGYGIVIDNYARSGVVIQLALNEYCLVGMTIIGCLGGVLYVAMQMAAQGRKGLNNSCHVMISLSGISYFMIWQGIVLVTYHYLSLEARVWAFGPNNLFVILLSESI